MEQVEFGCLFILLPLISAKHLLPLLFARAGIARGREREIGRGRERKGEGGRWRERER